MPKTTKSGTAKKSEIPSTLKRSDQKAQRTFAKAHDSALDSYGDEERANRTAWSAVKHTHEKVGDHWEPKEGGKKGPSDAQAAGGRGTGKKTKGGVDANATKEHLLKLAKKLDIRGRSDMKKKELVDAIQKANTKETAAARKKKSSKSSAKSSAKKK
ncbi:ChaB family protein [Blastococcus sp. TF02A-26]|uniref:ChaB family protein n=1 Tax=Blastococcus sp. TF02A-26 TaxID=2250577 RepID=UPI000DE9B508|nr:ChaB family protein [Blastococcus sp. TF02A-26]RBY85970.1 cation transport regulator ChaB [Blastococcus sp. TF02A-26]